jgi:hypothetical protein
MVLQKLLVAFTAAYVVSSPLVFLWFHAKVMNQKWDDDMADRVTIRLYILSNLGALFLAYSLIENWKLACPS